MKRSTINKLVKHGLSMGVTAALSMSALAAYAAEPIKVGLVAALSGQSAKSGEA